MAIGSAEGRTCQTTETTRREAAVTDLLRTCQQSAFARGGGRSQAPYLPGQFCSRLRVKKWRAQSRFSNSAACLGSSPAAFTASIARLRSNDAALDHMVIAGVRKATATDATAETKVPTAAAV